jgi:hypothetical protein
VILIWCQNCDHHDVEEREQIGGRPTPFSFCRRENMLSRHTNCVNREALEQFLLTHGRYDQTPRMTT